MKPKLRLTFGNYPSTYLYFSSEQTLYCQLAEIHQAIAHQLSNQRCGALQASAPYGS